MVWDLHNIRKSMRLVPIRTTSLVVGAVKLLSNSAASVVKLAEAAPEFRELVSIRQIDRIREEMQADRESSIVAISSQQTLTYQSRKDCHFVLRKPAS